MMEERNDMDDVMLPGFRFHPTDEELVGFYLKRKIQEESLPIELIKQVDIYKYDPWDLPKLANSGEKEWYFYCPRDRKYRNSARPNRVTKAGFWKATGTDRAIYSSEGKCIGLKKSLVFYRGRAAKGMKTDWMMHEFRLPCVPDSPTAVKKLSDKSLPVSWAICRIFKKTNSLSMAQKALSQTWMSQLPENFMLTQNANCTQFTSENNNNNNISCTTTIPSPPAIQFSGNTNFSSASNIPSFNNINVSKSSQIPVSDADNFFYTIFEPTGPTMLSNPDCIGFEEPNHNFGGFSISLPNDMNMQANLVTDTGIMDEQVCRKSTLPNPMQTFGFPFNLPADDDNAWNSTSLISTNKCYT